MIYVPRDAHEVLPEVSPKIGSVAQVSAAAAFMQDISLDADQYRLNIQSAAVTLASERSEGVASIVTKIDERLRPGAVTLYESAVSARSVFNAYASDVDRIHSSSDQVVREIDEALLSIRAQSAAISDIAAKIRVHALYSWREGAPGALPHPVLGSAADGLSSGQHEAAEQNLRMMYESQWLRAAALWRSGIDDVETGIARWNVLIGERRGAERRLRNGLGETSIGQLLSLSESSGQARRLTIAHAIAGELWGVSAESPALATDHPLLKKLIETESGNTVWDSPPDPVLVAANWAALSDEERAELIFAVPWVIGNLPGLPYAVRDTANRATVKFYQQHPQLLSPDQLKLLAELQGILKREAVEAAKSADGKADPPIQIVALDVRGEPPKVAVSYGDLDIASHTTWEVPGMNNDAHLALKGWDKASRDVHLAQNSVAGFSGSNAVVAWLGYDTPNLPQEGDFGVLSSKSAALGAQRFASELDGEHVSRSNGEHGLPYRNVLAHSYGTTVATIALTLVNHKVDALTMLGSAGLDTKIVTSLDILMVEDVTLGQKAIYTTNASDDHLAPTGAALSGRGLPNPGASAYGLQNQVPVYGGAFSFSVEGDASQGLLGTNGHSMNGQGENRDPLMGMSASEGHGYLDPRTQSLSSVARITTEQIDPRLLKSFVVTETQRVEYIAVGETVVAVRVPREEWK